MAWAGAFGVVFLAMTLPEVSSCLSRRSPAHRPLRQTSSPNILYRRAQRLRRLTGNDELKSQGQIEQSKLSFSQLASETLLRPLQMTFTEPIVIAINAYMVRVLRGRNLGLSHAKSLCAVLFKRLAV